MTSGVVVRGMKARRQGVVTVVTDAEGIFGIDCSTFEVWKVGHDQEEDIR